jgi:hypothetical protein
MPRIRSVVLMNRYLPILALMATLGAGAPVRAAAGAGFP